MRTSLLNYVFTSNAPYSLYITFAFITQILCLFSVLKQHQSTIIFSAQLSSLIVLMEKMS